jgi:hypothetical protein
MRSYKGKRVVRVYDYADRRVPVLKRMHEKRVKTYKAIGFVEEEDASWGEPA